MLNIFKKKKKEEEEEEKNNLEFDRHPNFIQNIFAPNSFFFFLMDILNAKCYVTDTFKWLTLTKTSFFPLS